jgi:hypothetical protein
MAYQGRMKKPAQPIASHNHTDVVLFMPQHYGKRRQPPALLRRSHYLLR